MEILTRNLTFLEETFNKQLKEIRKFATQMGVANHSKHEKRSSDIMSFDEEESHASRLLPEETEIRHRIPAEPPATDNTVSKICEMIRIIKPLHGTDDMGVENFIKRLQLAENSCSEPILLLQLTLAEKTDTRSSRT